jgi:nickel-type superoxide dismutase
MFAPKTTVYAHCDLPCGVYDPAQAKIEALSVKACMEKYAANPDADFRSRSVAIKEERSHQVKEHLWVLWTDYFKAPHFEAYPQLHSQRLMKSQRFSGQLKKLKKLKIARRCGRGMKLAPPLIFLSWQLQLGAHLHRLHIQKLIHGFQFQYM